MPHSKRRTRRAPESGDYRDPLSNYQPRPHADEMERSLCEDRATAIDSQPVGTIEPEATLAQALRRMADLNVACLVVQREDKPLGVFSERDVINRVGENYPALQDRPITDLMTPDPVVVYESDTPAKVMNLMSTGLFRHIPVVDADGRLVGIIGARRLTHYLCRQMVGPEGECPDIAAS